MDYFIYVHGSIQFLTELLTTNGILLFSIPITLSVLRSKMYRRVIPLLLLSGCAKISMEPELYKVKKRAKIITGADVVRTQQPLQQKEIDQQLDRGLSRQNAVALALKNNPRLQADLEELGIAKADLMQAGLYTNPRLTGAFNIPFGKSREFGGVTDISAVASAKVSDLWVVPLTKKVAQDIMDAVTIRVVGAVISTMMQTNHAYDECLYAQAQLKIAIEALQKTTKLRDEIYYRFKYGYERDLDRYNADILLTKVEVNVINYEQQVAHAFLRLREILGIEPTAESIPLTDVLLCVNLPDSKLLEDYALEARPEIQVARIKVRQAQDQISLERARVFSDVNVGISYARDFDQPFPGAGGFQGLGPYINFQLPIFDDNSAKIARAQFQLKQAQKDLTAITLTIKEEIRDLYTKAGALQKEISLYEQDILPRHDKAIIYTTTYANNMQLTMTTAIQAELDRTTSLMQLYHLRYQLALTLADLEQAVGKRIEIKDN